MNTTYNRESFVRSATADLSRQIDDILDHRFVHSSTRDPLVDAYPQDPNPMAIIRTLIKGLATRK